MKYIQKFRIEIERFADVTPEPCCEVAKKQPWGFLKPQESLGGLTKEGVGFKYCPYCGKKTEIVNVLPSKDEVKEAIIKFVQECGYTTDDDVLYDWEDDYRMAPY